MLFPSGQNPAPGSKSISRTTTCLNPTDERTFYSAKPTAPSILDIVGTLPQYDSWRVETPAVLIARYFISILTSWAVGAAAIFARLQRPTWPSGGLARMAALLEPVYTVKGW